MFDYKKTTIKQFTKQLNSAQRVKFFNGETKDFFTPQFIFLRALGLDRKNYKQQLNSKLVSEKEEKLSTLLGAFEYNQELLMENMIVNGKSDVLWRTIYANEYLENDTEKNQQITFYLGNSSRFQNE